ncbi:MULTISPECIES: gp436 family protein [unclassified Pseudomonas]|uniref:gp436 family protein n=1 Tax=unclassified Pseudomonas TaxID=196821 RepID=UPI000DA72BA8|nr:MULTISPECIES: phage protein Gp36 family protein [unclassified Pseudomonas]MDW3715342.1 phage protein Gp36 family protein [Pseudomonas sp. 2023EL-01195]PZE09285.1 DUF1320 domain-containing protein [Pseudomonas sp. 57B-090624]
MAYATREQFIDQHGLDAVLVVADRDQDGAPDDQVIADALVRATAEIDSWISVKHRLPLPVVPDHLVSLCGDIAMYRLSADGSLTEDKRKRYEDAVRYLRQVAEGVAGLGLPTPPDAPSSGEAFFESQPIRFGRLL